MISLSFDIKNPFWKSKMNDWQKVYIELEHGVTKNKTFEFRIERHAYWLVQLTIDLTWSGEDHAGPRFSFSLFGYGIDIQLRDNRHWNGDKNRWVNYNNPDEVGKWW